VLVVEAAFGHGAAFQSNSVYFQVMCSGIPDRMYFQELPRNLVAYREQRPVTAQQTKVIGVSIAAARESIRGSRKRMKGRCPFPQQFFVFSI
jgi:hypothetical protein